MFDLHFKDAVAGRCNVQSILCVRLLVASEYKYAMFYVR